MANNTLEVSLALKTGGFKSEIQSIKKENQLLRAEFDRLSSSVDNFEDTLEGKQAKLKLVTKEYENAKKQVEIYKKQVELSRKAVESANDELKRQKTVIDSTRAYIDKYKDSTGEAAKTVQEAEARLAELEKEFQRQAKAVVSANSQYQNMQIQLSKAEKSVNELGNELNECAKDVYKFDGKLDGLSDQLNAVEKDLDGVGQSALDFGAKMSEIGQGLVVVGENLSNLGQKGIDAISSLVSKGAEWNASVAGQGFVYNTLDEAVQKVIDSCAEQSKAIGLTNQQYKNSATNMASYYKNMGLTADETENLIGQTMQLVADLGAVNDIPFDDAMSRFKSGLMGNYEALDAFNINLSASMLENSEWVKSLGKSWNQLSDTEKMMAAYNEIVRQGAFATGLAEQEAQSFTMQANLLKQQVGEAAGKIGETLLPTLEPLISMVSDVVEKIVSWVEENPKLTTAILGIVGVVSALFMVLGPVVSFLGSGAILFGTLASAAAASGTTILGVISASLLPLIATIGLIIGVVAVVALAIKSNWEEIKEATNQLIETCKPHFEQLMESFSSLWKTCVDIYNTVIAPLFQIIGEVIAVWVKFCEPLFIAFMTAFKVAIDLIVGIWNGVGKPLFDAVMQIIQKVWEVAKPVFEKLAEVAKNAFTVISNVWNNILKPVFDVLMGVISEVVGFAADCFTRFVNDVTWAMNAVLSPIQWVIDKLNDLFGWISKASSKVGDFLNSINPFTKGKSMSINAEIDGDIPNVGTLNVPINPIGDVALSGSYYNRNTPYSEGLAKMTRAASNIQTSNQTQTSMIQQDNSQIANILESYLGQFVQAISNFNPVIEVGLNGRKVSEEINVINGQGMKLNERWR